MLVVGKSEFAVRIVVWLSVTWPELSACLEGTFWRLGCEIGLYMPFSERIGETESS